MKMIAIVSVHNDPNYGSALQAYALAYAIGREGYDCEYIDYTPVIPPYNLRTKLKALAKRALLIIGVRKQSMSEYSYWESLDFLHQRLLFTEFHNSRIPFSKEKYNPLTIHEANRAYDFFMVGSDQTWSPYVTKAKNTIFFLDFVVEGKLKGAYAPSLGTCHLEEEYIKKLKEKTVGFDFLSCRERHNAELLTRQLGKSVQYVLDPTLLLNKEEWLSIAESIKMPERYILCYILGTKLCISSFAEKIGKEQSIPVYYIVSRPEYLNKTNALKDVSPGQFINLIYKAEYVITDSFHGTLFSINFRRQFYAFTKRDASENTTDNDRIGDFLGVMNLSRRLKKDHDLTIEPNNIDYDLVEKILKPLREKSSIFLKRMLQNKNI